MRYAGDFFDGLRFDLGSSLPVIYQTEATECGLACLAMVAGFHGSRIDLPALRRRYSTSLKGATLRRLIEVSSSLGFDSRPLRLDLEHLSQLRLPCILHWDFDHFVVLRAVKANGVVIHDPARGVRNVPLGEVSKSFTGVALELFPKADFQPAEERRRVSLKQLTGRVHGLRSALIQIIILALAFELFGILGPFYQQWIIDQVIVSQDRSLLTLLGIAFLFVTLFSATISALRSWVVTYASTTLGVQWAANVFAHMLRLPLDYFEKRHMGDVLSRYDAVAHIKRTITTNLVSAILDGIMSVATLVVISLYSVKLTGIVVGMFVLYGAMRLIAFLPLKRATEDRIIFAARQQSQLLESIRGVQTLKLFNLEDERTAAYANSLVETANRETDVQRLTIIYRFFQHLLSGSANIVTIWVAASLVLSGRFTVGMLVAFATYATQFTSRADGLINAFIDLKMLRLYGERLADIALTSPEPSGDDRYDGPMPEAFLELRDVSFRYADGEPWVLQRCSFKIEPGSALALIGPSGGGKTTLVKLILGLLQPTEGVILYGGIPINALGLRAYRRMIAAVMQDDQLFAGSIADNISLWAADATDQRIHACAKMAGIHDEVCDMAMGYRSLVGDMGSSLSGGQKQRILLARALYRSPKLLVLDEATSHLDVARERQITAAIEGLDITRIIIAHRLETVANADCVCHLQNGRATMLDRETFRRGGGATDEKSVGAGNS